MSAIASRCLNRAARAARRAPAALVSLATVATLIGGGWATQQATAQPTRLTPLAQLRFPPTDNRGSAGRSTGGASRSGDQGSCPSDIKEVPVMLLPESGMGKSGVGNPTVYVYVPKTPPTPTEAHSKIKAEVTVADEAGEEFDRQELTLSGKEGIVKFSLLKGKPSLATGKKYTWSFSLICDASDRSIDRFAIGEVHHETLPGAVTQLVSSSRDELTKAQAFAENKFWYDALSSAAKLRSLNKADPNWASLLQSVKLEAKIIAADFL